MLVDRRVNMAITGLGQLGWLPGHDPTKGTSRGGWPRGALGQVRAGEAGAGRGDHQGGRSKRREMLRGTKVLAVGGLPTTLDPCTCIVLSCRPGNYFFGIELIRFSSEHCVLGLTFFCLIPDFPGFVGLTRLLFASSQPKGRPPRGNAPLLGPIRCHPLPGRAAAAEERKAQGGRGGGGGAWRGAAGRGRALRALALRGAALWPL